MKSFIIILFTLLMSITVAGCQTAGIENMEAFEASLSGIGVSMPPRDPFAGMSNVPQKLSDIDEPICYTTNPSVPEYVAKMKLRFAHRIKKRNLWPLRVAAEKTFMKGFPRHAAALMEEVIPFEGRRHWTNLVGNNVFAATFFAAYGELDKASDFISRAQSVGGKIRYRDQVCVTISSYWFNRAKAYQDLSQGNYWEALNSTLQAKRYLEQNRKSPPGECSKSFDRWRDSELTLMTATSFYHLGDLNKSESLALEVQNDYAPTFVRRAYQLLGKIKLRQGRYQDALTYALISKRKQICIPPESPESIETNRDIALALTALNRFDSAQKVMDTIEEDLESQPIMWENLFANSVDRGIILRETGRAAEAKLVFKIAKQQLTNQFGADNYFTAEVVLMGKLLDPGTTFTELNVDLRNLLALWRERGSQLTHGQGRQSIRLKWIVEDFLARAFAEKKIPSVLADAFEIAETLRSGMVQQALMQSALRRLAPDKATNDLIRRQQDMQHKLGVLRQKLSDDTAYGNLGEDTIKMMKITVENTETAVRQLKEQVRSAIPGYDQVVNLGIFNLESATKVLKPGEAVISLTSGRKESYVWVITADGSISGRKIAKTKIDWNDNVKRLRTSLEVPGGKLTNIPDFNTKEAYALYQDLLLPLEDNWRSAKQLIFITDNDLATIPMGMLLSEDVTAAAKNDLLFDELKDLPWLIRTHATSMVPSMTSLTLLRQGRSTHMDRRAFLGVGDPIFNKLDAASRSVEVADANTTTSRNINGFSLRAISTTRALDTAAFTRLPRLADTADEIIAIANIVGADKQRDLLIGSKATESNIRDLNASGELRQYRILSFATHGLIPGDLDGLLSPALALSLPLDDPKGDWDDGLLTSDEIMELDLDADWVILSACNTASAQASSTEAFSGLGQAFFYAGARSLLLSNWPVFSDSTRHLMESIFKHEATTTSRAQALRVATLEIMDEGMFKSSREGGLNFSYAHPLFWAPFTLVGDGGGTKPSS